MTGLEESSWPLNKSGAGTPVQAASSPCQHDLVQVQTNNKERGVPGAQAKELYWMRIALPPCCAAGSAARGACSSRAQILNPKTLRKTLIVGHTRGPGEGAVLDANRAATLLRWGERCKGRMLVILPCTIHSQHHLIAIAWSRPDCVIQLQVTKLRGVPAAAVSTTPSLENILGVLEYLGRRVHPQEGLHAAQGDACIDQAVHIVRQRSQRLKWRHR